VSAERAGAGGGSADGPAVACEGVALAYAARTVLRDVTFAVRPGERAAVLGPNGGGKTTLFRALTGELTPVAGRVVAPARCGIVPQTERSRLDFPVSALDVALMGAVSRLPWWRRPGRADRARARGALERVGLGAQAGETFGDLSGGQRQRVLLARALYAQPRILFLDEGTANLDEATEEAIADLMEKMPITRIVVAHRPALIRRAQRVFVVKDRKISEVPPRQGADIALVRA
jgi:ABC-type Mn2+/Zn2+ transport system ATPase subunit